MEEGNASTWITLPFSVTLLYPYDEPFRINCNALCNNFSFDEDLSRALEEEEDDADDDDDTAEVEGHGN